MIIIFCFSIDLPKLKVIEYHNNGALLGDNQEKHKATINGWKSFDNTLIMRSMFCYYSGIFHL